MREILEKYEMIEKLGEGLSGEVFSVRDRTRGQKVALKLSRPSSDSIQHIEKEFFTLSQLSHPNIVKALDFGRTKRRAYFTMEQVKGVPFAQHRFNKSLVLCRAAAQILGALCHIHARGLVHCDLKPANVLWERGGPMLLDFGLAALPDDSAAVRGSLEYIAPELFGGSKPDPRADLFSLGALIYENITGRVPFRGDSIGELAKAHQAGKPPPMKRRGLGPKLEAVVFKLIEVDPVYRYESAQSVLDDLLELLPGAAEGMDTSQATHLFSSPLVGREDDLGRLEQKLEDCRKGTAQVVLVTGQEGVGKSRLASELKIRAQMEGFATASARIRKLDPSGENLVPVGSAPALIVVEDVHLADRIESGNLVRSIRMQTERPAVFLLTSEPGRRADNLWSLLSSTAPATRLSLAPLERPGVEKMVDGILLDTENREEIVEAVWTLSGGVPLLVEETAGSMVRAGLLRRRRGRWCLQSTALSRIQPSDRSAWVMEHQVSEATLQERRLLEIASLVGRSVEASVLRDASSSSEETTLRDLTSLVNRGLMVREKEGEFSVSNRQLASIVVDRIPCEDLRNLHMRISELLARSDPALAAKHRLLGSDEKSALDAGLKQARSLATQGRTEEAALLYEVALKRDLAKDERAKILEELSRVYDDMCEFREGLNAVREAIRVKEETGQDVCGLRIRAAALYRKLGERKEAETLLKQILATTQDWSTECLALCDLAWVFMEKNQSQKALATAKKAQRIAEAHQEASCIAVVCHTLGTILWNEGNIEPAEPLLERAVRLKRELADYSGAADSLNNLGVICWSKGDMEGAEKAYARALKEFEKAKDQSGVATIHTNLGLVAWTRGLWEQALSEYESAYTIQERIGDQEGLARLDNLIGVAEEHLGNWSRALFHFKRHLRFARSRKDLKGTAVSLNSIGGLLLKLGDLGRAANTFEKCLALRRETKDLEGEGLCLLNIAAVRMGSGDLEAAKQAITDSIGIFERGGMEKDLGTAYRIKAEILLRMDQSHAALQAARKALGLAQKTEDRLELSQAYRTLGMVPRIPREERDGYFKESAAIAEEMNAKYELGRTLLSHGAFLLALDGRLPDAVQALSSATSIFERLGADMELRRGKELCREAVSRIAGLRGFGAGMLQVSALNDIAGLIGSIVEIRVLYERVVNTMVGLLGAERGLLLMFNEDGKDLELAAQSSMDSATLEDAATLSRSVVREAAGKGVPVISDDATCDPRFSRNRSVILNSIRSLLCVPLKLRDKTIGTLYVDSRLNKRLFSADDVPFVNTLANMMSVAIENARYHDEVKRENLCLRSEIKEKYSLQNVIGKSPAMQEVFSSIRRVAETDSTVLIEGETGTGKELVARAIHYMSKRAQQRFLTIDCGALPENLLESELFGHKKGSFTGAISDKRGLFEVSTGGTVFLDEIGDAPRSVQSRLLRVLEQSEVRRIGETGYRNVDVRILCATNRDLEKEIRYGRFRKDLYFRLNVLRIKLPALRDRREDIPLLANHFVSEMERELAKKIAGITPDAMTALMAHDWPGNVRELKNEIAKAATLIPESQAISRFDLSGTVTGEMENGDGQPALRSITGGVEKRIILESLKSNKWNRSKVAKELGLSRQGLLMKMRRHGILVEENP